MAELALPAIEQVSEQMASAGFAVLRGLFEPAYARVLQLSASVLPEKQVMCGIPNVTWGEQEIRAGHLLHRLLNGEPVRRFVSEAVGQSLAERTQCWTARYVASQYINEHRDVTGLVQLLICLQAPGPECGGTLRFGRDGELGSAHLLPGDGVLFYAARTIHSTSPLRESDACPQPQRLVAVARYFGTT